MSESGGRLADQARQLRVAFDRSFAEPSTSNVTPFADLVAFRAGSDPYALRLSEIAGLFADRRVTRVPSGVAAFIGLCSVRGVMAPVYDLHLLLGRPAVETPRWLALASRAPVVLAFEVFDGHLRVAREAIAEGGGGGQSHRLVQEFASAGGVVRPIVHLPSIVELISERLPRPLSEKER